MWRSASRLLSRPILLLLLLPLLANSALPINSSEQQLFSTNFKDIQQQLVNKNSGHFLISQLCPGRIPNTKRVEGAVLASIADTDVNCTITFRTKSSQQHFVIRFEELKLGCDDHLKLFDGDLDYGQPSIKDFSCRDNLANVPIIKTTGTYLTMRLSTDSKARQEDGFRLVLTAVSDVPMWDCPADYTLCHNRLCISRSLFCDGVNHCVDNSDELGCSILSPDASFPGAGGATGGDLSLSNALGLLVVVVLIIFTCVIIFILTIYCRRESQYAQYQHHLQRTIGVPLQTSSSLMFPNHHHQLAHHHQQQQHQYHYFQPADLSPYITPTHHHAMANNSIPRGYSTLPLNLARQPLQQQQQQQLQFQTGQNQIQKGNQNSIGGPNGEYLMVTNLAGPPTAAMQASPAIQTSLLLPTSHSIIAGPAGVRYPP